MRAACRRSRNPLLLGSTPRGPTIRQIVRYFALDLTATECAALTLLREHPI